MRRLWWVDPFQKANNNALGFFHQATLEGKVERGETFVTEAVGGGFAGYVIGSDTYHKREEVGVVYQMVVDPAHWW